MTKARKAILEALRLSPIPVSAISLVSQLGLAYDQATIYRNLHYLEDQGMAESFILHCSEQGTVRYYSYRNREDGVHHHWFHCERCHRFIDLGSCNYTEQLQQWEKDYGFVITDHTFFLTGICDSCNV
ncbi:MAG: Fur family transcriptional regulator [Sphaerochaeta sp.]|jgi:Fur family ferric uptake transcriptional regulator|uniref:Fur family transcriptional regulator n=1 Tax=Sphaerochaeta sp. TaxID=1972642 RepID=UPI002FC9F9A5